MRVYYKQKKRFFTFISTPIWAYLFLILFGVLCILICICKDGVIQEICKNLGYGIFASFLVSLFIDIGNTKRSNKEAEYRYNVITADSIYCCEQLLECVRERVEQICDDDTPLTYNQCIERIFQHEHGSDYDEDIEYCHYLEYLKIYADNLKASIEKMIFVIPLCLDDKLNDELLSNLTALNTSCKRIKRLDYQDDNERWIVNAKNLGDSITKAFPVIKEEFTNPYPVSNGNGNEKKYMLLK